MGKPCGHAALHQTHANTHQYKTGQITNGIRSMPLDGTEKDAPVGMEDARVANHPAQKGKERGGPLNKERNSSPFVAAAKVSTHGQ